MTTLRTAWAGATPAPSAATDPLPATRTAKRPGYPGLLCSLTRHRPAATFSLSLDPDKPGKDASTHHAADNPFHCGGDQDRDQPLILYLAG